MRGEKKIMKEKKRSWKNARHFGEEMWTQITKEYILNPLEK